MGVRSGVLLLLLLTACSSGQRAADRDMQQLPAAATPPVAVTAPPQQPSPVVMAGVPAPITGGTGDAPSIAPMQPSRDAGGMPDPSPTTPDDAGQPRDASAEDASPADTFALMPVGASLIDAETFAFPATALPPSNQSPEFAWTGVPANARSLALVFRDLSGGAVKWVIWDIPPMVIHLPTGITAQANPSEVLGSSQLGSLGNQGYAGPCCTSNQYEFVLWALDVEKLPGTAGLSTARIRDSLLPEHELATTEPVVMRIMP